MVWPGRAGLPMDPTGLSGLVSLVALIPWLRSLGWSSSWKESFLLSWLFGFIFHALLLSWVVIPIERYAYSLLLGLLCLSILSLGYGLLWGVVGTLAVRMRRLHGIPLWAGLPPLCMSAEALREHLPLIGQCLGNLGYSLVAVPYLSSLAALGGAPLLAGMIALVNGALTELSLPRDSPMSAWSSKSRESKEVKAKTGVAQVPSSVWVLGLALAFVLVFGAIWKDVLARGLEGSDTLRVALVQGNLDQGTKNLGEKGLLLTARAYLPQSESLLRGGAELLLWPEAVWPGVFPDGQNNNDAAKEPAFQRLRQASRPEARLLLTGNSRAAGAEGLGNTAFLLDERLSLLGESVKRHLLPLGETTPWESWLPIAKLVPSTGHFVAGDQAAPLLLGEGEAAPSLGVAICFDAFFSEDLRAQSLAGASLLSILSNDAWYGQSAGPHLFLSVARMRAIENARYLVRAANNGPSAIVDFAGRLIQHTPLRAPNSSGEVGERVPPETLSAELPLLEIVTPYQWLGDSLSWIALGFSILFLLLSHFKAKRRV